MDYNSLLISFFASLGLATIGWTIAVIQVGRLREHRRDFREFRNEQAVERDEQSGQIADLRSELADRNSRLHRWLLADSESDPEKRQLLLETEASSTGSLFEETQGSFVSLTGMKESGSFDIENPST